MGRLAGFSGALRIAAAFALAMCFCANARAGQRAEVEVRVSPLSEAWVSELGYPISVEVASRRSGTLNAVMLGDSWRIVRDVQIDAASGSPVRFETPVFASGSITLTWSLAGQHGREHIGIPGYYSRNSDEALVCVNAALLRELEALPERTSDSQRQVKSLPRAELPSDWQSYVGFTAMVLIDAEDLRQLTPRQTEAMSLWIKWLGGRLWIMGSGGDKAAERIGLPSSRTMETVADGVRRAAMLNGTVFLQSDADPSPPWNLGRNANANPVKNYLSHSRWSSHDVGSVLLHDLGGIRTEFIIIALAALGVLLGPVNYLIARRRKNTLLLYLLTPLCALVGSAVIIGGAFLMEGVGGEYNQTAILARYGEGNDAMLFDMRGVRPGFVLPALKFSAETLALPFPGEQRSEEVTVDLTDGVALGGGWLRPRFATGYLTARPLVCRMNVGVRQDGDGYKVVNQLGHNLRRVAVVLPDGSLGWTEFVAAGGEERLAVERGPRRYVELREQLEVLTGDDAPFRHVRLIAEAEGLPYIDDGGLGGSRHSGRYFYVIADDDEQGGKR